MLDCVKLMHALEAVSTSLCADLTSEYDLAYDLWQRVVADKAFSYKIKELSVPWHMPTWQDPLERLIPVSAQSIPYKALAVDGSQVYPDRHQGTSWHLINIGSVAISYNHDASTVEFDTQPQVFSGEEDDEYASQPAVDRVNCRRQELELAAGLSWYEHMGKDGGQQVLFYDGSLIFWHIASKEQIVRSEIMKRYNLILQEMAERQVYVAGYVSAPKSKDLVYLLCAQLMLEHTFPNAQDALEALAHVIDASLLQRILTPGMRTIVFCPTLSLAALYEPRMQPYFFYMHVGEEIVRIEIPAWIAAQESLVNAVASCAYDQALKGNGYPVVIAESHEQAVVRSADRDFFYYALDKVSGIQARALSQKSIKKRSIGI